ncbi:hypothetical protein NDU88_004459 [Pleurodeles waltl]|uniref:Uncharacterized protein n=1 Tax=Pleurodeles waltl TaxID=8319 RepID=A0AAV7VH61_PLEWA|nr:hypothetical protein NDU88_004459 [Pleurodeles waltl]
MSGADRGCSILVWGVFEKLKSCLLQERINDTYEVVFIALYELKTSIAASPEMEANVKSPRFRAEDTCGDARTVSPRKVEQLNGHRRFQTVIKGKKLGRSPIERFSPTREKKRINMPSAPSERGNRVINAPTEREEKIEVMAQPKRSARSRDGGSVSRNEAGFTKGVQYTRGGAENREITRVIKRAHAERRS